MTTSRKAQVATVLAFITSLISAWIADSDPVTAKEVAGWVLAALIASGITGGLTYQVRNQPKLDHLN